MNYVILALLILFIVFLLFILVKIRKKKVSNFNGRQPMLDKTNTIYKTIDGEVEFAYSAPIVKVHFSNNQELNITQWYTNEEKLLVEFKEFSKEKILKSELDEILKLNGFDLNELKLAVYNNKYVYVKDSQQVFICLFVTFGFYEQYWSVSQSNIHSANLVLTVLKKKDKHKKKSTFIKCE